MGAVAVPVQGGPASELCGRGLARTVIGHPGLFCPLILHP